MDASQTTANQTAPGSGGPSMEPPPQEKLVSRSEVNNLAEDAFRRGVDAMERADSEGDEKPVKVFGMFDIDRGLAAWLQGAWNVGSDFLTHIVKDKTYLLAERALRNTS